MLNIKHKGSSSGESRKSKAEEIFNYLHSVRVEDGAEFSDVDPTIDRHEQPGDRSSAGTLIGGNKPIEMYPDKPNITFTSVMPKKSSDVSRKPDKGFLAGIGDIKLSSISDGFRAMTGSPLVGALGIGALGAGALYMAYPKFDEPDARYVSLYGEDPEFNKRRKWISGLAGVGLAALGIAASRHPNIKGSWYRYLPKKGVPLRKISSMLGPADFIPVGFAQKAVMDSPKMSLEHKYNALQMLNSVPGGPGTMVNSTDIVSTAINTGASANGYPVGRATVGAVADALLTYSGAKAFGAENPGSIAAKVGLGSLGVRLLGSMF